MKVDYHIHSLHSDGIYTIPEIIPMLLKKGIKVFSITDHDTVAGTEEAREAGGEQMKFVSGIEFTCKETEVHTIGRAFSIHLLGYYIDERNEALLHTLDRRKENVTRVFDDLCRELTGLGYPVIREEIPISCGNVLQLCDVAHYLDIRYPGAAPCAFDMVQSYGPKLNEVNLSVEKAMELIHCAGGKAVWAHPFHVYQDFRKVRIERPDVLASLELFRSMGLDGIEAYYAAFCEEDRKWLYDLASGNDMICTAGSDFHGSEGRSMLGMEM